MAGQVGYVSETVVGTPVTVTRFLPFDSETLDGAPDQIYSDGIIAGHTMRPAASRQLGNVNTSGSVQHELYTTGIGLLLKHALGTVVTTGAGPYVHTFTPGTSLGASLTVQAGVPGVGGAVATKTMAGAKISSWEIKHAVGENSTLGIDLRGMSIAFNTALATASFPALGGIPFVSKNVTVTIGGVAVCAREITLKGENPLAERRCLGSTGQLEPLQNAYRSFTGDMTLEFTDYTQFDRVTAGTEAAVVITCTAGANTLVTTMNCVFTGESPKVSGPDIVMQPLAFEALCTSGGADSTAITMVLTNTDATPT
jgi:hypothetical protein